MRLLLGSQSPRRRRLLRTLGIPFDTCPSDLDETLRDGEAPHAYVVRMARDKAAALRQRFPQHERPWILTADTTVVHRQACLGKPSDEHDARRILKSLSGECHEVITAVCLYGAAPAIISVGTSVQFVHLTPELIDAYLATDEPWDKAGAYAIQGAGASLVRAINGSVSNVIGLPLAQTRDLLIDHGLNAGVATAAPAPEELL